MSFATLTVLLSVTLILIVVFPSFAQDVTKVDCSSTATVFTEDKVLQAATNQYLTAVTAKDWTTTSALSAVPTGYNLTQDLMQELLNPLKIERLSFEVRDASVKPCEASVRYVLSLRASDPRIGTPVMDVTGLQRTTQWRRLECRTCPPTNVTPWGIYSDVTDGGVLPKALAAAKTLTEQRLVLLGTDQDAMGELSSLLARRGYEFHTQGQDTEASRMFDLSRAVISEMKHARNVQSLQETRRLEIALADAAERHDKDRQGRLLNAFGRVYMDLGNREKALRFFEDTLRLLDASGGEEAAKACSAIAAIYRDRGEYERAIEIFLESRERYKLLAAKVRGRANSIEEGLTDALLNLWFLYEALGLEGQAQNAYDELLRFAILFDPAGEVALMPMVLGLVKAVKGDVTGAIEQMERASVMLTNSVAGASEDRAFFTFISSFPLVELYLQRSDYQKAAEHLLRARAALRGMKEEGETHEHDILSLESMLYGSQGDEQLAASRARQLFGKVTSEFLGRVTVGSIFREKSTNTAIFPDAMSLQMVGLVLRGILDDVGDKNKMVYVAGVLNTAAFEHLLRGRPEDLLAARKLFFRVLEMAEADGDELLIAQTRERIAGIYFSEGNYSEALDHYQRSLHVIERARFPLSLKLTEVESTTVGVWRNIARIYAASGNYEQAIASYRKVLDRSGRFYRLLDTTMLYEVAEIKFKQGRYLEALSSIDRGLAAVGGGDRDILWKLHTLAGRAHRELKQNTLAARSFGEAINDVEKSRSRVVGGGLNTERFFEDKLGPYQEMISMLVEQGKCTEALGYAERSKSRVLLDFLRRGRQGVSLTLTTPEREQERALRSRMTAADREFVSEPPAGVTASGETFRDASGV